MVLGDRPFDALAQDADGSDVAVSRHPESTKYVGRRFGAGKRSGFETPLGRGQPDAGPKAGQHRHARIADTDPSARRWTRRAAAGLLDGRTRCATPRSLRRTIATSVRSGASRARRRSARPDGPKVRPGGQPGHWHDCDRPGAECRDGERIDARSLPARGLDVHFVARIIPRRRREPPAKPPVAACVGERPSPAGGWNSAGT